MTVPAGGPAGGPARAPAGGAPGRDPGGGLLERAEALLGLDRDEQAGELFARIVADDPGNAPAWTGLARTRLRTGDLPGGLRAAEEALRADPSYAHALLIRGGILAALGRTDEALASLREGVRLVPQAPEAHLALARGLAAAPGGIPEAYDVANHAVRLAPQEASAHFLVGALAHRTGRRDIAEQAYTEALRLDPEHTDARNNLSVLHMNRRFGGRRRFGLALEGFADVAATDLTDRTARYNLEAMLFTVVARARWLGLLCLFTGMTGALASGAGQGSPPHPGDLLPRLVTIGVIALYWALWALRVRHRVPRRLRRPLLTLARSCAPVVWTAGAVALLAAASVCVVAVPWSDPAFLGAVLAPSAWLMVIMYWTARWSLRRRRPPE
ncbi:tetratricopeptide repeat protein [Streptomyces sp. Ru87]|uniref:tetratricopeptide repeat protein n=1 Tax=Streptomyces sp. Ru87 TaxID=2044307 RepID=UPI0015D497E0|nr:tetratricopeptide repeat protein [Streptomyces sp. Ru87]